MTQLKLYLLSFAIISPIQSMLFLSFIQNTRFLFSKDTFKMIKLDVNRFDNQILIQ